MTWRKREIMDEIHSCSPFCTRPMCVAEAVQAEREACAKVCDDQWKQAIDCGDKSGALRCIGIRSNILARGQA